MFLLLLVPSILQVDAAPGTQLLVETGSQVTLDIKHDLNDVYEVTWTFNDLHLDTNTDIKRVDAQMPLATLLDIQNRNDADYKHRVEFSRQNLSLILRKVTFADSGLYSVAVSRKSDETVAMFEVTVQAPVSAVSLSVSSVSSRSESCNFTVICQTELFGISCSFTCDNNTCENKHSAHAHYGPSSLHLYLSDLSIICNHSNHVNWNQDTDDVRQVCFTNQTAPEQQGAVLSVCMLKTVLYTVGLLLMLSAVITVHVLDHIKQD
ncbi:hypothetical protein WMY93_000645 [Mugilogobius chulae]|uniref:Immunoglobulin domain-containing protein n=1 Tax=Mugilogobius chulae TaxID=88201 RepID=A0AAW0Q2M3_9GOBI